MIPQCPKDLDAEGHTPQAHPDGVEMPKENLSNELRNKYPKTDSVYEKVQVLLFYWELTESDDAKNTKALADCFRSKFNFETEIYAIRGCGMKPMTQDFHMKMIEFARKANEKTLSITYYSGHGCPKLGMYEDFIT